MILARWRDALLDAFAPMIHPWPLAWGCSAHLSEARRDALHRARCWEEQASQRSDSLLPVSTHLCAGRDGLGVGGMEEDGVAFGVGGGHEHSLGL